MDDYEYLKQKLEEAKLLFQADREKTIFSVGGRGYYENPITDLLAFFFNPQEEHGFGTLFLESFFDSLNLEDKPISMDLASVPKREVSTKNVKRVDLILEGDDWVLVIENKIYHSQVNPFKEYEEYAKDKFKDKKIIFVILSPSGSSVSDKWSAVSYKCFINALKVNIGSVVIENQYSKWFVHLRDFILNLEEYAVKSTIDDNAIEFIEDNYQDITKLLKLKQSYIDDIQRKSLEKLNELFPDQVFTTTVHNWSFGPSIRFYSDSWVSKSNIVINISHRDEDKGIGLYMYTYEVPESESEHTDSQLKQEYHMNPWVESKTVRCYKSKNRYEHYKDIIDEFEETVKTFNDYNLARKS